MFPSLLKSSEQDSNNICLSVVFVEGNVSDDTIELYFDSGLWKPLTIDLCTPVEYQEYGDTARTNIKP